MTDESPPTRPSPRRHREVLAVAIGVAFLATVMEVRDDQRVACRGWSAYPIPELCTARAWFGVTCPGCGLTRGMIRLAHAEWSAAIEVHRLSGLMAFAILLQIPYRIACLRTGRLPFGTLAPKVFGRFLIGALFVNWAVGLGVSISDSPPPTKAHSAREPSGRRGHSPMAEGPKSWVEAPASRPDLIDNWGLAATRSNCPLGLAARTRRTGSRPSRPSSGSSRNRTPSPGSRDERILKVERPSGGIAMSERIILRTGEALVEGAWDHLTAEPEVVIGELDGPVGQAIAHLIGNQAKGHTKVFAILDSDVQVRPATLMVSKVTVKDPRYTNILMGTVQAAIAHGVLDSVRAGVIPLDKVNDLGIIYSVWLDPNVTKAEAIDHAALFDVHREATAKVIRKAMNHEPSIEWLLENQERVEHFYHRQGLDGNL